MFIYRYNVKLKAVVDRITKYVSQQYVKLRHLKTFKRVTVLDSTALAGAHISCFTACSPLLVFRAFRVWLWYT